MLIIHLTPSLTFNLQLRCCNWWTTVKIINQPYFTDNDLRNGQNSTLSSFLILDNDIYSFFFRIFKILVKIEQILLLLFFLIILISFTRALILKYFLFCNYKISVFVFVLWERERVREKEMHIYLSTICRLNSSIFSIFLFFFAKRK